MTHSPNSRLATKTALDVRTLTPRRAISRKTRRQELESKLAELQRDYAELHTSIFEAAQVHRRLCAPRLVRFGDFEVASEIFAVRQLPGDFFTIERSSNDLVMALGDVCGKGLAAGMWTPHLVGLVRTHTKPSAASHSIVSGVNRDACRTSVMGPLASLFLARLDPLSGLLSYCSAGHPPAMVLRADGELELLSEGGLLLGVLGEAEYISSSCVLRKGDTLLIYSDGITESRNNAGEEFGDARLEEQLRESRLRSADAALFSILGAVQDFAGTRPLVDDVSLAIIRRN